jgi:hypothetical protein
MEFLREFFQHVRIQVAEDHVGFGKVCVPEVFPSDVDVSIEQTQNPALEIGEGVDLVSDGRNPEPVCHGS